MLGPQFTGVRIVGAGPREVTPSLDGSAVLADGPVAFWRLGDAGGSTAVDATGNGYNGTYVGNVTPDPNAPSKDGAAYFDGQGSYVTISDAAALNPSQFTIEAWVNSQNRPASSGQSIVNIGTYTLYLDGAGNVVFYGGSVYPLKAPLPAGVWTYVAATLDSTNTERLYIDGVLAGSPIPGVPFRSNGQPIEIGSGAFSGSPTWKGSIDEVALYDKVLTPAQVQAHYAQAVYTGAVLDRGNMSTGSYAIELDGAVNVSISGLSIADGAAGIYADAGSGSRGLTVQNVDLYGNGEGIDVEASNDEALISASTVHGSSQDGIYIASANPTISGSTAYGNGSDGIQTAGAYATITGNAVHDNGTNGVETGVAFTAGAYTTVEDNAVFDNRGSGIYTNYGVDGLISGNDVYGNGSGDSNESGISAYDYNDAASGSDQLVISGNRVHDNLGLGISTYAGDGGEILVVNNTVYGNQIAGIVDGVSTEVRDNVVYGNKDGIVQLLLLGGFGVVDSETFEPIDGNRVFGNTNAGITALGISTVVGNVVYSNSIGIEGADYLYINPLTGTQSDTHFNGSILNNVVYANSTAGILIQGADGAQVTNNTVYQPLGVGVRVTESSSGNPTQNVELRNNIIWTQVGYDINVYSNSQQGFDSNYNLLYTTGTGQVGYWQGDFATLRDWQFEVGQDAQSITGDPEFLDPAGPDGILGEDPSTGVDGGQDDDFHLQTGSPGVAAGDPASDYSAQPSPSGGRINLGAYGDTPQATTTAGAGVIIDQPGGSIDVVNGGAEDSYTIVLTSQPTDDVTVTLSPDKRLSLSTATVTFTPADWNVAQSVTVKAVFDAAETGDDTATITHAVSSSDPKYNGIAVPSVTVQIVPQGSTPTPSPTPTAPTITWSDPADIFYGTPLGPTQLDASASAVVNGSMMSVPGTFTYTPAAGTVLPVGDGQTLSVTFTPTDTADFTSVTATATINVLQATPTITWANPAAIAYGTALSCGPVGCHRERARDVPLHAGRRRGPACG